MKFMLIMCCLFELVKQTTWRDFCIAWKLIYFAYICTLGLFVVHLVEDFHVFLNYIRDISLSIFLISFEQGEIPWILNVVLLHEYLDINLFSNIPFNA